MEAAVAEEVSRRILIDARPRTGLLAEVQLRAVRALTTALASRNPADRFVVLLGEDDAIAFDGTPTNLAVERLGATIIRFWFDTFGARSLARRFGADVWVSLLQSAPRVPCASLSAVDDTARSSQQLARPGIDLEAFRPAPRDTEGRRIIFAEPVDEEAAEFLIRTYVLLAERIDAPDLILIGARDWPRALWTRPLNPVARRIHVHRAVSEQALRSFYSEAELVVVPAEGAGAGHALLAGLASGTPVVSVDLPALRRIGADAVAFARAEDEESLAKTMAEVLAPSELSADLASKGLARAAEFSWEHAAQAFEEACSAALLPRPAAATPPAAALDSSVARA